VAPPKRNDGKAVNEDFSLHVATSSDVLRFSTNRFHCRRRCRAAIKPWPKPTAGRTGNPETKAFSQKPLVNCQRVLRHVLTVCRRRAVCRVSLWGMPPCKVTWPGGASSYDPVKVANDGNSSWFVTNKKPTDAVKSRLQMLMASRYNLSKTHAEKQLTGAPPHSVNVTIPIPADVVSKRSLPGVARVH